MNYEQAEKFIHKTLNFGSRPGLERISELCQRLDNPQDDLKFVHVAGTNGKGSTVTMIACALEDAGYTVGKYTSPYVYDFRERIEVNGKMIEKNELAKIAATVEKACLEMDDHPTEFEVVTAIGFLYFKEKNCDYVVLEVGMGGRLDATNIIKSPCASVICSISLDHVQILGDTEEKIAGEKAGIIKDGCPCVAYADNSASVTEVFKEKCRQTRSDFYTADLSQLKVFPPENNKNVFEYKGVRFDTTLHGGHQVYNALNAITALEVMGIDKKYIVSGVCRANAHARYETVFQSPRVIVDAGHNKDGVEQLISTLKADDRIDGLTVIFGMLKDKAYQFAIREIASLATRMICVKPDSPRALSSFDMKNIAEMYCDECYGYDDAKDAVDKALEAVGENETILVCGSFYIIEKVVKELNARL